MDTWNRWERIIERYWVHILAIFADLAGIVAIAAAFLADHGRNLVTFYVLALLTVLWGLLVIQNIDMPGKLPTPR